MSIALIRPLLACLLLSFIAALSGPLEIILTNTDEFDYGVSSHLKSSAAVFIVFTLIIFLPLATTWFISKPLFRGLEVLLLTTVILALTNKTLLYGDYGAFDGRGLELDTLSVISVAQILLAVVLMALLWRKRAQLNNALTMAAIYTALTLISIIANFYNSEADRGILTRQPSPVTQAYFEFSTSAPNYLYILLDEVYGGSARQVIESDPKLSRTFKGFTFYNDATGMYPTTLASVPAILNGSLYQNMQPVRDYISDSFNTSALFQSLQENNYPAYIHTSGMYCQYVDLESCSNMGNMLPSQDAANQEYGETLDLTIFKMVPEILKPMIYNEGNWLFGNILVRSSKAFKSSFQVNEFRYFINEVNTNGSGSSFKFYHNTVTHSPVKLDAGCTLLLKNRRPTYENYLEQDKCGFSLVQELLVKLKDLNVYDNTFIVISSDHGRPLVTPEYEAIFDQNNEGVSTREYGYAHATLMVKPLNSPGELQFSERPVSLFDVSHLFRAAIDDPSIKELPSDSVLNRPFHYYFWSKKYHDWRQEYLPPFESVYNIGPNVTSPSSWQENIEALTQTVERSIHRSLPCDDPIVFSDITQQEFYVTSGLSAAEPWGRWSAGPTVRIYFRGQALACREGRIRISILAYLRENKRIQHAEVLFNGQRIGEINFQYGQDKHQEFIFDFSPEVYLPDEINEIELRIANPISPKKLGDGRDGRRLALGLKELQIY